MDKEIEEYIKKHDYSGALQILEEHIKKEPNNFSALGKAGLCHARLGNFKIAEAKFEKASVINPNNPWIWQQYGYVLFQLGKIVASINALETATEYDPYSIWINHQLAFLYSQNKEYEASTKYINKAIDLCEDEEHLAELLTLKAAIYENYDKDRAIDIYFSIIEKFEDDAKSYDRISSLIIDKFKFSKNLSNLNLNTSGYNEATQFLRLGELEKAISAYKDIIKKDKYCYPAYLGIAQAMYEMEFGSIKLDDFKTPARISELFTNYKQLTKSEKNIVNASVSELENFIKKLQAKNSHFIIVPIDVCLTDFPSNHYLKNKHYLEQMPYDSLRGIGGSNGYVGIERLRDLIWRIPSSLKFTPACVAHEFAHQVWCLLDYKITGEVKELYIQAQEINSFISNYSRRNPEEYFAEYYSYYTRLITSNTPIPSNDPMINMIISLKNQ